MQVFLPSELLLFQGLEVYKICTLTNIGFFCRPISFPFNNGIMGKVRVIGVIAVVTCVSTKVFANSQQCKHANIANLILAVPLKVNLANELCDPRKVILLYQLTSRFTFTNFI